MEKPLKAGEESYSSVEEEEVGQLSEEEIYFDDIPKEKEDESSASVKIKLLETPETGLHCLACGSLTSDQFLSEEDGVSSLIKCEEVSDNDFEEEEMGCSNLKNTCGKLPGEQLNYMSKGDLNNVEECKEKRLFLNFCDLMGVKITGIKLDELESKGVKDEGGSVVPSFCRTCRNQLTLLMSLQEKLRELERDLENGVREFVKMCEKAEDKFEDGQVYKKDKIYEKIRKQICGKIGRKEQVVNDKDNLIPEKRFRKSTRTSLKTSLTKTQEEDDICIKVEPEVPNFEEENNDDADFNLLDDSADSLLSDNADSSDDYEPPAKKKPGPKSKRKVGRPPKRKAKTHPTIKKKSPARIPSKAPTTTKKKTSKKYETDNALSDDDDEEPEDDSDEDIEASLKGRMSTDPATGNVTFLHISFEALSTGRFRCLTCDKDSAYHRGSLKKHVITMHTDMFVCQECDQHCPSSKSLNSHIRRVHRGQDRTFVECPVCGKPCSSKRGRMEKHMSTHLSPQEKEEARARGEEIPQWSKHRRHVCEKCGRGYELRSHLIQHKIREHPSADYTDEEKVACKEMCPDCGKLVHRHYLKKHQESVHSEGLIRRFPCILCERRFYKESDLKKHKNVVHDKIKPWKCSLCPKQFALKTQMNYHMHTHQNIRPFQCDHCTMAFARKHHLERHLRIYHEPGSNPKRKTYVKGPETKAKTEEELERENSGMGKGGGGKGDNNTASQFNDDRDKKIQPVVMDTQMPWLGSTSA